MGKKLSDDVKAKIKSMRAEGYSYSKIAQEIGVSEASVSYVVRDIDRSKGESKPVGYVLKERERVFSSDTDFLAEAIVRLNNRVDRLERIVNSK